MTQMVTDSVSVGDFEIALDRRLVTRNGDIVHLTRNEWFLLEYLAVHAGKVVLNDELLRDVWGPEYEGDWQYLRVWISRLRRKLEPRSGEHTAIKTMQGMGYMLDADGPDGRGASA